MESCAACTAFLFDKAERNFKMKKILGTGLLSMILLLCGCTGTVDYDGKSEIEKARVLHTGLESASVSLTGGQNGGEDVTQEITYRFAGEVMQYLYHGTQKQADGTVKEYYEFNNGTEIDFIDLPEDTEWNYYAKGSEDFYSYSKTSRHYFADGTQLFSVYEGAVTETKRDGNTLTFIYNPSALIQYESFRGIDITDFTMTYEFNNDGYCTSFSNTYTVDGDVYNYNVVITDMNAVDEVKRPELF